MSSPKEISWLSPAIVRFMSLCIVSVSFPQVIVLIGHVYHITMFSGLGIFCWFLMCIRELILQDAEETIFRKGIRCEDTWLSGLLNQGTQGRDMKESDI